MLFSNIIFKVKIKDGDDNENKLKSLFTFFTSLKKPIQVVYYIFKAKKTFNLLLNTFIYISIFHCFDLKYHIIFKLICLFM